MEQCAFFHGAEAALNLLIEGQLVNCIKGFRSEYIRISFSRPVLIHESILDESSVYNVKKNSHVYVFHCGGRDARLPTFFVNNYCTGDKLFASLFKLMIDESS